MNNINIIFLFSSKICWNMHVNDEYWRFYNEGIYLMFRKECFETINITRPRDLQGKLDHSCRLLGKELWHILCIYQLIKITPASRRTRAKLSYRQCIYIYASWDVYFQYANVCSYCCCNKSSVLTCASHRIEAAGPQHNTTLITVINRSDCFDF